MINADLFRRFQRPGSASLFSVFVSALLLTALLLQIVPFSFRQAVPSVGEAVDGVTEYFKPLQVCGDSEGPGGFLADLPWIQPSLHVVPFSLQGEFLFPSESLAAPEAFPSKVYRPPRFLLS